MTRVLNLLPQQVLFMKEEAEEWLSSCSKEDIDWLAAVFAQLPSSAKSSLHQYLNAESRYDDADWVRLRNLTHLVQLLNERGDLRFSVDEITAAPGRAGVIDWSVLPENLRYLKQYAGHYGDSLDPQVIDARVRKMTEEQRCEMTKLAARYIRDEEEIRAW